MKQKSIQANTHGVTKQLYNIICEQNLNMRIAEP